MEITVSNQLFIFISCVLCGVINGFVFDVFRIIRRLIRTSNVAAIIEDIIYWIIAAVVLFLFVLKLNSGELRFYQFIGVFLGTGIYFFTVSSFVIRTSVIILRFITRVVAVIFKIIMTPVMFVYKLIRRPFLLVFSVGKKSGWRMKHRFISNISNFNKYIKKI